MLGQIAMIDPHIAESLAVSYGTEDWCGPWELEWGLKTHYPNESPATRKSAAASAMRTLINAGMIQLHPLQRGISWPPEKTPLSQEVAIALVDSLTFWLPPSEHNEPMSYWFCNTEKGDEALGERKYKSL